MTQTLFDLGPGLRAGARLSPCRRYRYQLWRVWNDSLAYLNIIGLNPSKADELRDDHTIRRCVDFAKRWGYGGLFMTNLFAFRATDPGVMRKAVDPIGAENDYWLIVTAAEAGLVVAAWGAHGTHLGRDKAVLGFLPSVYCLGTTKDGSPKHPLRLPKTLKPLPYTGGGGPG